MRKFTRLTDYDQSSDSFIGHRFVNIFKRIYGQTVRSLITAIAYITDHFQTWTAGRPHHPCGCSLGLGSRTYHKRTYAVAPRAYEMRHACSYAKTQNITWHEQTHEQDCHKLVVAQAFGNVIVDKSRKENPEHTDERHNQCVQKLVQTWFIKCAAAVIIAWNSI